STRSRTAPAAIADRGYTAAVTLRLLARYPARPTHSRIVIARGSLPRLGALVRAVTRARRVAVVSDATVARLHGGPAMRSLRRAGLTAALVRVPRGEPAKSAHQLE